jgi:hypothetical protein
MSATLASLRSACVQARWTWAAVGIAAVVLLIRKSWALTTPQLWAEDGSVHLLENDQFGAAAIFRPYRGYLHLLPRLIAWLTSHVADVAWWPLLYNGTAFLILLALLVLAFALAAHSNEVFFNITNLHWVTAFFLLQQVLIKPPKGDDLRLALDLALIAVVGLTGPFIVVFFPLFVWRWWRDRCGENLDFLLAAGACAAIQGWLIYTTGPTFENQSLPLKVGNLLGALGTRLATWPLFGAHAATHWPVLLKAALGVAYIGLLLGLALRRDSRRELRLLIVAAFILILAAAVRRIRPDTWDLADIAYGDSYLYIPRVLLAWLLVWELDAARPAIRHAARALVACAVLLQLPDLREPPRPDYQWREHCAAIRERRDADIPILPEGWILKYRPPESFRPR